MTHDGWHLTTLGMIAKGKDGLQTGPFGSQLHAADYVEDGIPVVMPKNIVGGRVSPDNIAQASTDKVCQLAKHVIQPGDILFGRRGDIGRCALITTAEQGWVCGTGCLRVRLSNSVDPNYLIQQLRLEQSTEWLVKHAVGQTMLNLNTKILAALPILLPPLPEQKRIAEILGSVDEAIQATKAVIKQTRVVKQGLLQQLLTRGIGHSRFKQTEIGEIPEAWKVVRLEDVTDAMNNGVVGKAADHYVPNGIPYLMAKNVRADRLDFRSLEHVSKDFAAANPRAVLHEGDVVTVQSGHIGTSCSVPRELDKAYCHALIISRPKPERLVGGFESYYLNSTLGRKRLGDIFVGSTIKHVNTKDLRKFLVPLPKLAEQRAIVTRVESVDESIISSEREQAKLSVTKSGLMQDLLTGRVRVKV